KHDVDYLFAQVDTRLPRVDYSGSCGNLATAVGLYALEEGILFAGGNSTTVNVWQVNTRKSIQVTVPTFRGKINTDGLNKVQIDGIPFPGAPITVRFIEPGGSATGRLLPTGNPVDHMDISGRGSIQVSLVDAATPVVFVPAEAIGLSRE